MCFGIHLQRLDLATHDALELQRLAAGTGNASDDLDGGGVAMHAEFESEVSKLLLGELGARLPFLARFAADSMLDVSRAFAMLLIARLTSLVQLDSGFFEGDQYTQRRGSTPNRNTSDSLFG